MTETTLTTLISLLFRIQSQALICFIILQHLTIYLETHCLLHDASFEKMSNTFNELLSYLFYREDATSARLPARSSDMSDSELLESAVFFVLLVLVILGFFIFTICTARNYALMTASLSLGLIVLFFIVHQFYNKVVVLCTRPRANIPLVVYNRPNLPPNHY